MVFLCYHIESGKNTSLKELLEKCGFMAIRKIVGENLAYTEKSPKVPAIYLKNKKSAYKKNFL